MKKLGSLVKIFSLLVFLTFFLRQTKADEIKTYKDQFFYYQITFPSDWLLANESAETGYVALYDQRALSTTDSSLELLLGIKIEILADVSTDELQQMIDGCSVSITTINQGTQLKLKQYWQTIDKTFMIIVPVMTKKQTIVFIAYVPELDKKTTYWRQFNQILASFKSG